MLDQLKQLGAKLAEIWGQIGLNQRISIVLTGGAILAGLITLAALTSGESGKLIATNISDAEAARITDILDQEKIRHEITGKENSITVSPSDYHKARMKLAVQGVPEVGGKGYKVFDEPSFGRSDYLQRLQHQVALQQELEMTIEQLEEVDSVRVHIVPPKRTLLVDPTTMPKASVFIKKSRMKLQPSSVDAIQSLVAHAVEGLEPGNVSVIDEQGRLLSRDMADDSLEAIAEGQLKVRQNHEKYLTDKVQTMLDHVLGVGKSKVTVDVALTTDAIQQVSRMYNPTNQVIINETSQEQFEISSSADSGVPGVPTNSPVMTNSMSLPPGYSSITNIVKDIQYGNEELTTTTTKTPGSITNISASVLVDTKYQTDTNGVVQPLLRTTQEIDELRLAVMTALNIRGTNNITVSQMPFENTERVELLGQIQKMDRQMFYLELGKQIMYLVLPLMFFFGFVRMWKKSSAETIPIGVPVGELSGEATATAPVTEDSEAESSGEAKDNEDEEDSESEAESESEDSNRIDLTDEDSGETETQPSMAAPEPKDYELELPFSEEELMAGLSEAERHEIQEKIRKINQWIHEKPDTVVRTVKNWLEEEDTVKDRDREKEEVEDDD